MEQKLSNVVKQEIALFIKNYIDHDYFQELSALEQSASEGRASRDEVCHTLDFMFEKYCDPVLDTWLLLMQTSAGHLSRLLPVIEDKALANQVKDLVDKTSELHDFVVNASM